MNILQRIRKIIAYSLVSVIGFFVGFVAFHNGSNFLLHTADVASADVPPPPPPPDPPSDGGEP